MIMCMYKDIEKNSTVGGLTKELLDPAGFEHSDNIFRHIIAVTNRHLAAHPLPQQVERVCRYHPKAVILREKDLPEEEYSVLAREIMDICKAHRVPCILHTYLTTARELDCPAIHLPLPLLREHASDLHSFAVIGTSVHSIEDALEAGRLGATYVTAGHIYATDCKKGIPPRGTEFLREVCHTISLPAYAIGGIKPDSGQIAEVLSCGAAGGCVMSGMMTL